jgi:hypothetical protein
LSSTYCSAASNYSSFSSTSCPTSPSHSVRSSTLSSPISCPPSPYYSRSSSTYTFSSPTPYATPPHSPAPPNYLPLSPIYSPALPDNSSRPKFRFSYSNNDERTSSSKYCPSSVYCFSSPPESPDYSSFSPEYYSPVFSPTCKYPDISLTNRRPRARYNGTSSPIYCPLSPQLTPSPSSCPSSSIIESLELRDTDVALNPPVASKRYSTRWISDPRTYTRSFSRHPSSAQNL